MSVPMWNFQRKKHAFDLPILLALTPLFLMSFSVLYRFSSGNHELFFRQLAWLVLSCGVALIVSRTDTSFLTKPRNVVFLYLFGVALLSSLFFIGVTVNGARSWIHLGPLSFQPADFVKLIIIVTFAKFLTKRHRVLRSPQYVFFSLLYFLPPFLLIFIQPDFGSALIILAIWFGMIMLSGLSKKHFFFFLTLGLILASVLWLFVLKPYQKERITSFLHPLTNIHGAGYNAFQSVVAVGSGGLLGKGVGLGTQSRLSFLPEHETDFIFAAIAEEWGFLGAMLFIGSYLFILFRLLSFIPRFEGNFERLFTAGFVIYLFSHFVVNVGMNIGLMPITGVALPFASYGGSHLLIECLALGIIFGFRKRIPQQKRESLADAFLM